MTVGAGQDWGEQAVAPPDALVAHDDVTVASHLATARATVVRGGDLHRTVGQPSGAVTMRLSVDAFRVAAGERTFFGVANVVARRPGRLGWWHGPVIVVANAQYLGAWDVAPRAHPNDGRLDVIELDGAAGLRQRLQMRRRLATGTHVPHPALRQRRVAVAAFQFERALSVFVDGIEVGGADAMSVSVLPDAGSVYV